jgi:hypothetical protein
MLESNSPAVIVQYMPPNFPSRHEIPKDGEHFYKELRLSLGILTAALFIFP